MRIDAEGWTLSALNVDLIAQFGEAAGGLAPKGTGSRFAVGRLWTPFSACITEHSHPGTGNPQSHSAPEPAPSPNVGISTSGTTRNCALPDRLFVRNYCIGGIPIAVDRDPAPDANLQDNSIS